MLLAPLSPIVAGVALLASLPHSDLFSQSRYVVTVVLSVEPITRFAGTSFVIDTTFAVNMSELNGNRLSLAPLHMSLNVPPGAVTAPAPATSSAKVPATVFSLACIRKAYVSSNVPKIRNIRTGERNINSIAATPRRSLMNLIDRAPPGLHRSRRGKSRRYPASSSRMRTGC